MKKIGSINNVIIQKYDGSSVPESDEIPLAVNFSNWFDEDITQEINDKEITVVVIKDYDNNNHIHLATNDVDLILRVQKAFWKFYR